jgi:phospholipid transport system substrate-binding protein
MNRKLIFFVALLLLPIVMAPLAVAEDMHPAATLVMKTADEMMARLRAERDAVKKDKNRVNQLVEEIVLPHFDFENMSASVLGKYWRTANADQRQRFRDEFKTLLLRTYANALVDNMDKKIEYEPVRAKPNATDVTVRTNIPQDGGFPLPINYSMELIDNEWKVYDVEIDAISLVKNYRTTFSKEVKESGIEHLIETLKSRNKEMIS